MRWLLLITAAAVASGCGGDDIDLEATAQRELGAERAEAVLGRGLRAEIDTQIVDRRFHALPDAKSLLVSESGRIAISNMQDDWCQPTGAFNVYALDPGFFSKRAALAQLSRIFAGHLAPVCPEMVEFAILGREHQGDADDLDPEDWALAAQGRARRAEGWALSAGPVAGELREKRQKRGAEITARDTLAAPIAAVVTGDPAIAVPDTLPPTGLISDPGARQIALAGLQAGTVALSAAARPSPVPRKPEIAALDPTTRLSEPLGTVAEIGTAQETSWTHFFREQGQDWILSRLRNELLDPVKDRLWEEFLALIAEEPEADGPKAGERRVCRATYAERRLTRQARDVVLFRTLDELLGQRFAMRPYAETGFVEVDIGIAFSAPRDDGAPPVIDAISPAGAARLVPREGGLFCLQDPGLGPRCLQAASAPDLGMRLQLVERLAERVGPCTDLAVGVLEPQGEAALPTR